MRSEPILSKPWLTKGALVITPKLDTGVNTGREWTVECWYPARTYHSGIAVQLSVPSARNPNQKSFRTVDLGHLEPTTRPTEGESRELSEPVRNP